MESELRQMVNSFRVTELQTLLQHAGKNRSGRKNELLARAIDLVKKSSHQSHIVLKIRELYRSIQQLEWLHCFKLHSVVWKSLNLSQYKVCLDHFEARFKVWRGSGSTTKVGLCSTAIPTLCLGEGHPFSQASARVTIPGIPTTSALVVTAANHPGIPQTRATRASARLSTLAQQPPASTNVPNPGRTAPDQQQHPAFSYSTNSSGTMASAGGRMYHVPTSGSGYTSHASNGAVSSSSAADKMLQNRNPYAYNSASQMKMPGLQAIAHSGHVMHGLPICPDVRLKRLPFYDILTELHKPTSLISQGGRVLEANFPFVLTPLQAGDIASSKEYSVSSYGEQKIQYGTQVQLRFCALETTCDQEDLFPPSLLVKMNGKLVPLPHPIPSNRPGVEPKRPSRPLNVTNYVKLSPLVTNTLNVNWASDISGRTYTMSLYMVKKLDSKTLLNRLKGKGLRQADFTRGMIKDICQKDDSDCCVATTSLKVSLACPLGKCRMGLPCRANTCSHLQCFDANLFLQMNEKKPTWLCPVCDKPLLFESLAIDGYFDEIINKISPSAGNDVEILPDGSWTMTTVVKKESHDSFAPPAKKLKPSEPMNQTINLDDDLIIEEVPSVNVKVMGSSEGNSESSASAAKAPKAPPEFVDLTMTSDEEEDGMDADDGEVEAEAAATPTQSEPDEEDEFRLRKRTKKPNYVVDDSSDSDSSTSTKAPDSPACITLDSPSNSPGSVENARSSPATSYAGGANAYLATSLGEVLSGGRGGPSASSSSHFSAQRFNAATAAPLAHSSSSAFSLQGNMGGISYGGGMSGAPLTRSQSNALERQQLQQQQQPTLNSLAFPTSSSSAPTYLPFDGRGGSGSNLDYNFSLTTDFTALEYPSMDYFNQTNSGGSQGNGNGGSRYGGGGGNSFI